MIPPVDSTLILKISIYGHRLIDHLYRDGVKGLVGKAVDGGGSIY